MKVAGACADMTLIPNSLSWNGSNWESGGRLGCRAPNNYNTAVILECVGGVWYLANDGALWSPFAQAATTVQCPDATNDYVFKLVFTITVANPGSPPPPPLCCNGSTLTITINN